MKPHNGKKIDVFHHILSCEEERLIQKVILAQEKNPVKNDWCLQVKDDLKLFKLDYLSFNDIKFMKKNISDL